MYIYFIRNKKNLKYVCRSGWRMGYDHNLTTLNRAQAWTSLKNCRRAIRYYINDIEKRITRYKSNPTHVLKSTIPKLKKDIEKFFEEYEVVRFKIEPDHNTTISTKELFEKNKKSDALVHAANITKIIDASIQEKEQRNDIIDGI